VERRPVPLAPPRRGDVPRCCRPGRPQRRRRRRHACADALLGAAGLGDIGQHFPDTDPQWKGADSVALLAEVARRVRAEGWEPGNVDCSVVLDAPKLAPVRRRMAEVLTEAVGAPVTVTGRRTEGIGSLGRGEGVMAMAVAVVTKP
jgi:2-C-methyl-D-erythritol 2,4-cyclodiphosphate synthase